MKVVPKPIHVVLFLIDLNGTVGCSTHRYSSTPQPTTPATPTTRGASTCADVQAYSLPPQVRPMMTSEMDGMKTAFPVQSIRPSFSRSVPGGVLSLQTTWQRQEGAARQRRHSEGVLERRSRARGGATHVRKAQTGMAMTTAAG